MMRLRVMAAMLACTVLGGCMVGPNFKPPAPPVSPTLDTAPVPASPIAGRQSLTTGEAIPERWWTVFGSPRVDALVDQALAANPDIGIAMASLRQARAQLGVARAGLLPTADADYQVERVRASRSLSPPLATDNLLYTLHTAQLSISYPLDLFGGIRRTIEASRAQAESVTFQYEAARLTIATNTVLAIIEEASLREQIAAAEQNAADARAILAFSEQRQKNGDLGAVDVAAQRSALAQAEQVLPGLRKALDQQRAALSVLLGQEPAQPLPPLPSLDELVLPQNLPLSLPSELVRQRPDIRTAEADLHAASANVGVAVAARLPAITLSAFGGGTATSFGDMFAGGASFWSLAGGVAQPLFHGGALLKQQRAAEAGFDKAKAQYRTTVLSAFADVANTLSALRNDADYLQAALVSEASASEAMRYARRRLELGNAGGFDLLNAQIAYQSARAAAVQARAARYADTVALFQALGGGWWNRAD